MTVWVNVERYLLTAGPGAFAHSTAFVVRGQTLLRQKAFVTGGAVAFLAVRATGEHHIDADVCEILTPGHHHHHHPPSSNFFFFFFFFSIKFRFVEKYCAVIRLFLMQRRVD